MPPQPLSRVDSTSAIEIANGSLPRDPVMAAHVFYVVDIWSQIDFQLALLLTKIIPAADAKRHADMHLQLKSLRSRQDNLKAVAAHVLPRDEYALVAATIDEFRPSNDVRNDFCHGLWGSIRGKPDHFLLMDMEIALDVLATNISTPFEAMLPPKRLDKSKIKVWRPRDFEEAAAQAASALRTYRMLNFAVGPMRQEYLRDRILGFGNVRARFDKILGTS